MAGGADSPMFIQGVQFGPFFLFLIRFPFQVPALRRLDHR
jgi:hypothetical protein